MTVILRNKKDKLSSAGNFRGTFNGIWRETSSKMYYLGYTAKQRQCFMGKYGKIHHFPWEKYGNIHHFSREHMERSTIFHGKIWTDPPFFMGNSFTCQGLPGLPGLLVALGPSDTELIPTLNKFIPFQWWVIKTFYKRIWSFFQTYLINL